MFGTVEGLAAGSARNWRLVVVEAGFEEVELLDASGWIVLLDAVDYGGPQRSSCGPVSRRVWLGWRFSDRSRTRLRIRGIVGAVPTINTTLGACEGLDVVVAMVVSPRPERAGQADQDGRPSGAALPAIDLSVVLGGGVTPADRCPSSHSRFLGPLGWLCPG